MFRGTTAFFYFMQCSTCFKVNKDEALKVARDEARAIAVKDSSPVAIVVDREEYFFYNAFFAYDKKMNVVEVVSHL